MLNQPESTEAPLNYDGLMQANLARVFSERDAGRRIEAIRELYAEDAVLYEPQTSARGHAAISEAVTSLLTGLPPDFVFRATGPAIGHHRIGRLHWRSGPPDGPAAVTGMDVAHFEGVLIHSLYVFLDPFVNTRQWTTGTLQGIHLESVGSWLSKRTATVPGSQGKRFRRRCCRCERFRAAFASAGNDARRETGRAFGSCNTDIVLAVGSAGATDSRTDNTGRNTLRVMSDAHYLP
ncbi:MAG: nuclear transport factor 2 family protein [Verrucomicrobia bacterium]|nr:nuclear transport factor 2 family protein [Deltaproteobacteria bacterium]